ncbi:MAG: hypothetical protein ACOYXY_08445 [Thermodesulfobacteriota bacterium]
MTGNMLNRLDEFIRMNKLLCIPARRAESYSVLKRGSGNILTLSRRAEGSLLNA